MSMETTPPAPPFDPELTSALSAFPPSATADVDQLIARRDAPRAVSVEAMLTARSLFREDFTFPGPEPGVDLTVSVFRTGSTGGPGFYFAHGGGMVMGDRFRGVEYVLDWIRRYRGVAISVEYRLAPEHPDPAPVEDTFAGLVWATEHAAELGFDPRLLIATGISAGGGLIAGATLLARARGVPLPAAQVLISPMLDDRDESGSTRQFDGHGVWDRASNRAGWTALLGDRRTTDQVSPYAAPARATDLSGLPPTYLDCGSAEVFRDEVVAFAGGLWAAGGVADLHVWAGACHGFDLLAPGAAVSAAARATRTEFVRRVLETVPQLEEAR